MLMTAEPGAAGMALPPTVLWGPESPHLILLAAWEVGRREASLIDLLIFRGG